jgi:hypothetical protein
VTARWPRLALAALLAFTAALYLWNLSVQGYGNTFYAAAAQAGAQSWSAWFFGALDARDFITVDKPPGALWVTGLSVRLFGMNHWSVLAPQAVMGVAAVAVVFITVRRTLPDPLQGNVAGLLHAQPAGLPPQDDANHEWIHVLLTEITRAHPAPAAGRPGLDRRRAGAGWGRPVAARG